MILATKESARPFCAGIVKVTLPLTADLNVVVTQFNVVENGRVVRRKLMALHPVDRARLTPLKVVS